MGDLKRYVDERGRMRSLTAKDAARLGGFTLADQQEPNDSADQPVEGDADQQEPKGTEAPHDSEGASVIVERPAAPAKVVAGKGAK